MCSRFKLLMVLLQPSLLMDKWRLGAIPLSVAIAVLCKISFRSRTDVLQRLADVVASGVIEQDT